VEIEPILSAARDSSNTTILSVRFGLIGNSVLLISDDGGGGGVWTLIWDSSRGFFGDDDLLRISLSDEFEIFFFDDSFRCSFFVLDLSGWSRWDFRLLSLLRWCFFDEDLLIFLDLWSSFFLSDFLLRLGECDCDRDRLNELFLVVCGFFFCFLFFFNSTLDDDDDDDDREMDELELERETDDDRVRFDCFLFFFCSFNWRFFRFWRNCFFN